MKEDGIDSKCDWGVRNYRVPARKGNLMSELQEKTREESIGRRRKKKKKKKKTKKKKGTRHPDTGTRRQQKKMN